MDPFLQPLIDERNAWVWETVNEAFALHVQLYSGAHHRHDVRDRQAYLFLAEGHCTVEAFTHELLHLYLRAKRIYLTEWLVRRLQEEPLLHWTFSESLFEQIGHYLEHIPMLPLYLRAGLDRAAFIPDFTVPICNPMLVQLIEGGLNKAIPSIISADLYIRTFVRIKAYPDPVVNYGFYLQQLQQINPNLFDILQRLYEQWSQYSIADYHPDRYSYTSFCSGFMHELGAWTVLAIHAKEKKPLVCHI